MKGSEISLFKDEWALIPELVLPVPSGTRVAPGLHGVFHGREQGVSAWPELLLLLLCGAGEGRGDTWGTQIVRKELRFFRRDGIRSVGHTSLKANLVNSLLTEPWAEICYFSQSIFPLHLLQVCLQRIFKCNGLLLRLCYR